LLRQKKPFRVGEVCRGQERDPLDFPPPGHDVEGHVPGRGARKLGMKMKVGDEFHDDGNSSVDNLAKEFKGNIANVEE
jgi:hypothetical protein